MWMAFASRLIMLNPGVCNSGGFGFLGSWMDMAQIERLLWCVLAIVWLVICIVASVTLRGAMVLVGCQGWMGNATKHSAHIGLSLDISKVVLRMNLAGFFDF